MHNYDRLNMQNVYALDLRAATICIIILENRKQIS